MASLSELREKYPQYNDMSDQDFADKFHAKYYSDLPKNDFYSKIGFSAAKNKEQPSSIFEDLATSTASVVPELASMAMSLPQEAYGAITHPLRTLKNIPIGVAEGAAGALNLPGNIAKYLSTKGYLPEAVGKAAGKYAHIPVEQIEEKLGILPNESGEALTRGLSGFGLWGKLGKFGEASHLKRAGLGAGYAAGSEQNPITGALLSSIPGLVKGGQNAYEYLRAPGKAVAESKESLQAITHLLEQQKMTGEAEKTDLSRFLNHVQEGLTNKHEQLESQLPEIFPIKPKSETRSNLNLATKESIKNLSADFDRRYKEFEKGYGEIPVNKPFDWDKTKLEHLPHVSVTTKQIGHGVSKEQMNYTNDAGEDVTIDFPAPNSSVQDYINFSRELRDAAWNASKAAKNATYGEATSLRKTGNRLKQLQGEAEEKIRESVGDEAFNHFKQIQKDYAQLMGPVKTEPSLFNAAYKNKISDKIHDTLLQPVNEHIKNYLYQSPEFVTSLREHLMQGPKHPLKQGQPFNPASINQDIQYLLTPQQRMAQAERLKYHENQNYLNDISKHLQSPETLTPQQEQAVHQFHPRTSQYLMNDAQRRAIIRKLEHQKTEESLTKEEKEKQSKKRKMALGFPLVGVLGAGIGVSQAHRITNLIRSLF